MKKLKLSRTKVSDVNQPKISNFFTLSKDALPNQTVEVKNEENKTIPFNNKEVNKNTERTRPPGETLCAKCLRISPKNGSDFCTSCNLQAAKPSLSLEIDACSEAKPVTKTKRPKQNCFLRDSNMSSPDIIPPTPPTVCKGSTKRLSEKTVKRKFNFGENACDKKKYTFNSELQNICCSSEKSKFDNNSISSLLKRKENGPEFINKNPFLKLNTNTKAEQKVVCRLTNVKTGINNENTVQIENEKFTCSSNTVLSTSENFDSMLDDACTFIGDLNSSDKNSRSQIISDVIPIKGNFNNDTKSIKIKTNSEIKETYEVGKPVPADSCDVNVKQLSDSILQEESNLSNQKLIQATLLCVNPENKIVSNKFKDQLLPHESPSNANEDINASFLDDISFDESTVNQPIRLDSGIRCKVTSVEYLESCGEVVLTLKPCNTFDTDTALCVLRGSWTNTVVSAGDTVTVTAQPVAGQHGCWVVDNDYGLVVAHPDTLVSGTMVVGSLFCMRRSVLSDMYRGMDSESSAMAIGSFLHELLQEVLKRKIISLEGIKEVLNEFLLSRHFIFSLYSSGMSLEKTKETLLEFVPRIHAFVQKYIAQSSKICQAENWNNVESWGGSITDIADIEENIWAPTLGIKGKVDVTVKTFAKNKQKVMPLELKTGRASFSAEHRGQVILYTMMMSELGQAVDSGLLLYLREGMMKEVQVGAVERRDLILLRNQLVTQLKTSHQVVFTSSQQTAAPVLPPPIHHHSACAKCPYLTLCSAALRMSGSSELSDSNPLHGLSVASTDHLQEAHMVYVFHWTGLLRLEHTDNLSRSVALHDIWTLPPAERKKRGTCMPNVELVSCVAEVTAGNYEHVFEWNLPSHCGFAEGDYVIVSSNTRPAVAAGPVRQILHNQLTLHLERDLSVRQKEEKLWHLDKYESQSGLVFNMTNLGCLLDNTEQACRLRRAVISLELPTHKEKLSSRVLKASVDLVAPLNDQQRKAIFRVLAADHFVLIKGMPGTGKTATLVALIQLAVRLGLSVLLTSHTHSAVDNVLLRLRGKVDFLRLGSAHKLHPELAEYGETRHSFSSPEDIHNFYNSKSVVAVTCLGSSHPLLSRRQFDLCLVDEATQVLQPTVLRPLFSAHKFVLIGDPNQLPPLVRSSQAKELGLGESLFVRLDRPAVTSVLSLQYRMNERITELANTVTYAGKLHCANPVVGSATLTLPLPGKLQEQPEWVARALSDSLDQAVIVLDTGVTQAVNCANQLEVDIVIQIVTALNKTGVSDERVGVIAPYRAQVELLRKKTKALNSLVEVNTVDQYQGRDKDVILYSCTRSVKPTESDILGDRNRLTVAITRARHKLIIIGNVSLLRGYALFNTLFHSIPDKCMISIF